MPDPEKPAETPGEETPAGTEKPSDAQLAEAIKITKEIKEKLDKGDTPALPTASEFVERIKQETGMTDPQIAFVTNVVQNGMAPVKETLAKNELRAEFEDFKDHEKAIDAELAQYDAVKRGDKSLIRKIYFMTKGEAVTKNPPKKDVVVDSTVTRERISGAGEPSATSLGGGSPGGGTKLSDEEKVTARKMGVSESDYQKWKGTTIIQPASGARA